MGYRMVGKTVALFGPPDSELGCWAEYVVTDVNFCMPLPSSVPVDKGACSFVNPLTVVCMAETVKNRN